MDLSFEMSITVAMPELLQADRQTAIQRRQVGLKAAELTAHYLGDFSPKVRADMFKFTSMVLFSAEVTLGGRKQVELASLNPADEHDAELDQAAAHLLGNVSVVTSPEKSFYITDIGANKGRVDGGMVTTYPIVIASRMIQVFRDEHFNPEVTNLINYRVEL